MAIVVRGSERVKYPELFNKMFRLRYETFVCNRGWALPHRNGLEIDEYDTDDTVYFIALDGEGNIESTLRITPPCAGGLTEDCFPHLVESVANLSNPSVCELTRYIVVPRRYHGIDERAHKTAILVTMLEWALAEGMTAIRAVTDIEILTEFLTICPLIEPLGLPTAYGGGYDAPGGGVAIAVSIPVQLAVLEDFRRYGQIPVRVAAE